MPDERKVAIAVPVHNGAAHLKQCLDCLSDQDSPNMQVLIFENCSTDASADIAREFCDQDARFSFHPSDRPLDMWSNFSRAVNLASRSGDFFAIRAHDDLSTANFISELSQKLIENPNAALAVPAVERIFGEEYRPFKFKSELLDIQKLALAHKFRRSIRVPAAWFYGMYRSSLAADIFLSALDFFPHPWGGDRFILMQFLLRGQIVINETAVFKCRMGSGNEANYVSSEIKQNLGIRFSYTRGLLAALHENRNLSTKQRAVLLSRILMSAPVHTHTSLRQIFQRRFAAA